MNNFEQQSASSKTVSRPVFSPVGVLLSRPALWGEWLAKYPDRAELFRDAFSCVIRLESHTGWPADIVLDHLGCDTKTEEELGDLDHQRLDSCVKYMQWVESLLGPLDLALDKQMTLNGAARLFAAADEDLAQVKEVMDRGAFPPKRYLRLGEIGQAWKAALQLLPRPGGDHARRVRQGNPFVDETTPHMSPMRLQMLAKENATQLLGERIEIAMREHLEACPACAAAQRRVEMRMAANRAAEILG